MRNSISYCRELVLQQVEVIHLTDLDRIIIRRNVGQTSRMQNLHTTLDRLILHELPALERMDGRQSIVVDVPDLIGDVHLIIVDTIDDTLRVPGTQNQNEVGGATQLIGADELIHTLVGSDNGTSEVQLDGADAVGSLVGVLSGSNHTNQLGRAKHGHSHVRIVQDLQHDGNNMIQVVHEHFLTILSRRKGVTNALRREVERGSNLLAIGHTDEAVVQVMMDLVVLVVTKNQLDHGHDLSQLIGIVQGGNILDLVGRDRGIDRIRRRNLDNGGTGVPTHTGSADHGTGGVDTGSQTNSRDYIIVVHDAELVLLGIATQNSLLGHKLVGIVLIAGTDLDARSQSTVII